MPMILRPSTRDVGSLEELMDYYSSIDMQDRDAIAEGAPALAALANNRGFLAQRIAAELKDAADLQRSNQYSSQVFFLGRGKDFFVRANFWPAIEDAVLQASGPGTFFYGVPHDHNFDFITVGYFGPGYISDFYEYDFDKVVGYPGEPVDLRFVCREALPEGRVILYRGSLDIHEQLAPESFSISLNVVADKAEVISTVNQYMLDLDNRVVSSLGNRTSLPLICEIASYIGDEECMEVLSSLARCHPHARGRFSAIRAMTRLCPSDAASIWSHASSDSHQYVSEQARLHLQALELTT